MENKIEQYIVFKKEDSEGDPTYVVCRLDKIGDKVKRQDQNNNFPYYPRNSERQIKQTYDFLIGDKKDLGKGVNLIIIEERGIRKEYFFEEGVIKDLIAHRNTRKEKTNKHKNNLKKGRH